MNPNTALLYSEMIQKIVAKMAGLSKTADDIIFILDWLPAIPSDFRKEFFRKHEAQITAIFGPDSSVYEKYSLLDNHHINPIITPLIHESLSIHPEANSVLESDDSAELSKSTIEISSAEPNNLPASDDVQEKSASSESSIIFNEDAQREDAQEKIVMMEAEDLNTPAIESDAEISSDEATEDTMISSNTAAPNDTEENARESIIAPLTHKTDTPRKNTNIFDGDDGSRPPNCNIM